MCALLVRPLVFAVGTAPPGALAAFYDETGLTPEIVGDADARIEPDQLRRAWRAAIRLTGEPHLALRLATAMPAGAFGLVEYVVRSAPTTGDALALGLRYLHIVDEVGVAELVDGDTPDTRVLRVVVDSPIPHEACFAAVVGQGRLLAGSFRPVAVELAHRPEGDHAEYERFFEAPVRFGAPETRLVLSRASLATPLATADPNLLPILVRHAEELLARASTRPGLIPQVRRVLCETLRRGEADVEHVASRLGVTPRSLQRRLKDEGTTFQLVRDELRRELAHTYLDSGLSIAEVSFLLGFSETSAFFRAFKRWTGTTPLGAQKRGHAA